MRYLSHLKRYQMDDNTRWIVKYDSNNKVKEVKQIFDPEDYITSKEHRPLHNQKELIKILEDEKTK